MVAARFSPRRDSGALLDGLAGALSNFSRGSCGVLAQHRAPRHDAARRTAIRTSGGLAQADRDGRGGATDARPHFDRSVVVRDRYGDLHHLSDLGEHHADLPGPAELCDRAADPDPAPLLTGKSNPNRPVPIRETTP